MTPLFKRAWFPAAVSLALCIGVFAVLWGARAKGRLQFLELDTYSALLRRMPKDNTFASKILIVGIDENDIKHFHYPIPDEQRAMLVEKLRALGAAQIGLDLIGDQPVGDPAGSARLKKVFEAANDGSVIGVELFKVAGVVVDGPPGLGPENVGFAEIVEDNDDRVRRQLIFAGGKRSFNFLVAVNYLSTLDPQPTVAPDPNDKDAFQLGPTKLHKFTASDGAYVHEDSAGFQLLMDYRGPSGFRSVTLLDVLEGNVKKEDVDGKIVLVGMATPSVKDYVSTPIHESQFGVQFQGICVDHILRIALRGAHPMSFWPDWAEFIWTLGWGLAGGLLSFGVRSFWRITLTAVAGLVILLAFAWFMLGRGVWVPVLPPALVWGASATLVSFYMGYIEKEDRTMLRELFSRHVSRAVVDEVWSKREQFFDKGRIPGAEIMATVLFTDLKNFTTLSLTMSPGDLMKWLNEYMEAMSQTVEEHGGFVNKYIGDAIMAVFGAPIPKDPAAEARAAVACALAMRKRMSELRPVWDTQNMPDICMRIGIMTGKLVVGSLGSQKRLEYTVIGDTVNTAARLESYDKNVMDPDIAADGCRIIIGQQTFDMIAGHHKARTLGHVKLKGREKEQEIAIYGVIQ